MEVGMEIVQITANYSLELRKTKTQTKITRSKNSKMKSRVIYFYIFICERNILFLRFVWKSRWWIAGLSPCWIIQQATTLLRKLEKSQLLSDKKLTSHLQLEIGKNLQDRGKVGKAVQVGGADEQVRLKADINYIKRSINN